LDEDSRARVRSFKADWGLLLPNSIGSAIAMRKAGLVRLAGYDTEYRGFLLEKSMSPPAHRLHQTDYYLGLLQLFNGVCANYPIELNSRKNSFVVIHPGASKMERAWSLDRFLQVADALSSIGKEVMFVSGHKLPSMPYPVAVRPSLYEFAGLLKESSLFIGNDSGPLHLAQQCGAPVVGVYGPGDPFVTGPRKITPSRVVYHGFPCSPCRQKFFRECDPAPTGKPFCIETISTQEVVRASLELLEGNVKGQLS
jgi:heptosyltransferase-2